MKQKAKILQYKSAIDCYGHEYLDCFIVKRDCDKRSIYVDPTVCLEELEELSGDEQIEWAVKQIGKYLHFEDLSPVVYETVGKTYIV